MNDDEGDNVTVNRTKMIKVGSMDDVFILDKATNEEMTAVLFLHSLVPKIKRFTFDLRYNHDSLTSPYMKAFEEIMCLMVFFMIDTESKDPFKCDGVPKKLNQKYFREIKIIDLLIDILIYSFEGENPMYNIDEITQRSPITRICQLIYRTLKHCVNDNRDNKFYVAQWISHFFHQSLLTTDENNLCAEDTITEILNNNK